MFSLNLTTVILIFIAKECFGTIVKENSPTRINIWDQDLDNEVINVSSNSSKKQNKETEWTLRYFPEKSHHHLHSMFADRNDMYAVDPNCDDGVANITLDLENLVINVACFRNTLLPDTTIPSILHEDVIPKAYDPPHVCMEKSIEYTDLMISFGAHRPLWAEYGEYEFIPKQRWLHNLEHGAIVMLYHPCAHPLLVNQLKKIVTSCLRRHIITPYGDLPTERPLAVYAWSKYLSMNVVDPEAVRDFIRQNALKGPENIPEDGKYNHLLIKKAQNVSYPSDAFICPHFPRD